MKLLSRLAVATVAISVAACGSNDSKKVPATQEYFKTNITTDGSKQFDYTLLMERPEGRKRGGGGGMANRGGMGAGGAGDMGGRGDMDARKDKMRERMELTLLEKLDTKLTETTFCREGYMELARTADRGRMTLRGECREQATDDDRAQFPNHNTQPPSMLQKFEPLAAS